VEERIENVSANNLLEKQYVRCVTPKEESGGVWSRTQQTCCCGALPGLYLRAGSLHRQKILLLSQAELSSSCSVRKTRFCFPQRTEHSRPHKALRCAWNAVDQQAPGANQGSKFLLLGCNHPLTGFRKLLAAYVAVDEKGRGSLCFTVWLNEVLGKTQLQNMHTASVLQQIQNNGAAIMYNSYFFFFNRKLFGTKQVL